MPLPEPYAIFHSQTGEEAAISSDFIQVTSYINNLRVTLTRYYKSDWQGVVVGFRTPNDDRSILGQVYTLDCRSVTDKVDEIVTAVLKSIPK